VVEVVPRALPDKGTAFAMLMRDEAILGSIFIGDDLADTAIFREIRRRRSEGLPGLAIGVVDAETPAVVIEASDVQVAGVSGVEALLTSLAERLTAEHP
jgi:trehalose 6-phosphate phosphatase